MKTGIKQMLSNVGNLNRLLSNPTSTELDQTALTSKTFQRKHSGSLLAKSSRDRLWMTRRNVNFDILKKELQDFIHSQNPDKIIDLDIAGGQLVKLAEICYNSATVQGYSNNELDMNDAIKQNNLQGKYESSNIDELEKKQDIEREMKRMVNSITPNWSKLQIIGNPAYTIGKGRTPIYDVSLEVLTALDPNGLFYIIPMKWMSRMDSFGKKVRSLLKNLGIKLIIINDINLFASTGVKTETCTVICEKNYDGNIVIKSHDDTKSFMLTQKEFDERIFPFFDKTANILKKYKPTNPIIFESAGDSKATSINGWKSKYVGKWIAETFYKKEGYEKEPINPLKPRYVDPAKRKGGAFMVINAKSFDNKADCEDYCEKWNSYLLSTPIKWHWKNTRMSPTLDPPQYEYVPNFINNNPTKIYTDEDIYKLGNYSKKEIDVIKNGS